MLDNDDSQDTKEDLQAQLSDEDSQQLQHDFAADHNDAIANGEGPLATDEFNEQLGDTDVAEDIEFQDYMEEVNRPAMSDADEDLPQ